MREKMVESQGLNRGGENKERSIQLLILPLIDHVNSMHTFHKWQKSWLVFLVAMWL